MASDLKITTEAVREAASAIETQNSTIDREFSQIQKSLSILESAWLGPAAENLKTRFRTIRNQYFSERSLVIRQYTGTLRRLIGEGYEETESENRSLAQKLADRFR